MGAACLTLGILVAVLFIGGIGHPVSEQVPATVPSFNWYQHGVVVGFIITMTGAALLVVTEVVRPNRRTEAPQPSEGHRK